MDIVGEHQIAARRDAVFRALNDPEVLQRCIPGCTGLERVGENTYEADITAAIGPVRAKFKSRLNLEDVAAPERYRLLGEAKAGAAGFGRGAADVTLSEAGEGTLLRYAAEFKVGGRLAQVGSRIVLQASKKTADAFFAEFVRTLDAGGAVPVAEPVAATPARYWPLLAAAAVLLVLWFLLR